MTHSLLKDNETYYIYAYTDPISYFSFGPSAGPLKVPTQVYLGLTGTFGRG